MKAIIPITFLITLFSYSVKAVWMPSQGMTWNYVLGNDIDEEIETAQVVDIDVNKSASKIKRLQEKGIKVICYFSAGTLETFRDDAKEMEKVKNLVRNTYEAWPDEKWLDIRVEGLKPILKKRMKLAVQKNCDAIEVDNLDGYQMKEVKSWENPLTKEDTIKFAKWLSKTAHDLGLSIGLKNVAGLIDELSSYFDFAINEECVKYNECKRYSNFLKQGKAVFGVTYNGLPDNRDALCRNLDGLGISMIIKNKKKLVQGGITFNGKEHCNDNFDISVNSCFATHLGYPCCAETTDVIYTDEDGGWGYENNGWCGIAFSNYCFSNELGYPCCSKGSDVVMTDEDGDWGFENNNWCGISIKSTCFSVALGYPCCIKTSEVVVTDSNGSWGIENEHWCGIRKSSKKVTKKVVTTVKKVTTKIK